MRPHSLSLPRCCPPPFPHVRARADTGKYTNAPTFNVSARPTLPTPSSPRRQLTPRQLTPIQHAPAPPKADVPWFMQEPEDAPMGGDGEHVDHSLEMWRNREAMGGGAGYTIGYRFDGKVDAAGAFDTIPITEFELESAHDAIRQKLKDRFATFRRAFQAIDEDRDGKVTKIEALRVLMMLNLTTVREKVMNKLCDIMDQDGNGVDYNEFCNWIMADDAKHLATGDTSSVQPRSGMVYAQPKPPTPRQHQSSTLRPPSKPPTPRAAAYAAAAKADKAKQIAAMHGDKYDWLSAEAEDAPDQEYNGGHVDHSLEMFRTGVGMGAGAGYAQGYRFDGDVEASGGGDNAPVTEKELEAAHDIIREKLQARFTSFRKAFKEIDENRSGRVTKVEALRMLMMLNLTNVREKVMNRLCDIMDRDGNGVDYNEFSEWLMADDAKHLALGFK